VSELWKSKFHDNGDKDRVRDATDIVRLIGEHVALKTKGRELVGLCPFHNDKNPSMNVVPAKQIFHCFVCNAGGDCFAFAQKFHKMDFREALEYLAERAGITLTKNQRPSGDGPAPMSRGDVLHANATAAEFFKAILSHPEHGKTAREVIAKRRIAPEMVAKFMLGASPERWDGLMTTVQHKRLDPRAFFEAGLFKKRENSDGAYDAFRNRVMFPIQDQIGRVIAFGARKIRDEDEPKYLNSAETRVFNKSGTLYALNHAAKAIQTERTAIITEGYTDVIACHQAGFCNAVATLGTALTREHAAVLRRLCDRVVLLFDGDEAGQRAADRAVEVFFSEDLDVAIATLNAFTDAKDPDELLKREGGGEVFRTALDGATDLLEYRFARLRQRLEGAGMAALSRALKDEIGRLVELGLNEVDPIRQKLIVKRLASVADLDETTIASAIPAGRRPRPVQTAPGGSVEAEPGTATVDQPLPSLSTAPLTHAEHLLGCVLCDGQLLTSLSEHERDFIAPAAYRYELLRRVAQVVHDIGEDHGTADLSMLIRSVDEVEVKEAAIGLAARVNHETDQNRDRLHAHWRECLRRARLEHEGRKTPPAGDEADALMQQIKLKRAVHASLGADRRVFPRPG
jgi:DNA primase